MTAEDEKAEREASKAEDEAERLNSEAMDKNVADAEGGELSGKEMELEEAQTKSGIGAGDVIPSEEVPKARGVFFDGKRKWVEKLVPVQSSREDIKHIKFGAKTLTITFQDGLMRAFDYSLIPQLFDD